MIIIKKLDNKEFIEAWGALTDICEAHHDFKYNTLKDKKYPFEYKGFYFQRIKYKTRFEDARY